MTKRMLIDASHPEETRVVVVNDRQLEEFEFESSTKKQLKGNIYLAKVTRVEPSLQAAFVDYGGQRHGFLAFSEIHPDYYQIPQADRRLLDEAERQEAQASDGDAPAEDTASAVEGAAEAVATDPDEEAAEVFDEQAKRRSRLLRGYKIQEVIKRRQIILVQVVKEERGNKGAALTTYLSLAGRYSVLMPNTARGGGISRKIADPTDRSRLKSITKDLDVPEGMGLIVRTAGQERNKLEIKRDYEYSLRLWNDIRDRTLESVAPCTIHEEGALVKRAIRDLYARDIDEVWVEGEEGYREARKMMNMLMPSRVRRVKLYKDEVPLFHHYAVEEQLDALHDPVFELASGGSIVIHATEALTAIDVNSGRSTRERNIEETALKTNLEAAHEISRQLRLRDIAGLVVIDFIDMAESRNQRAVERKLRELLKADRARVQLGRISTFGLLELSRQRLRPSFQELSSQPCPTCHGSATVRSVESATLQALRAIELEGMKGTAAALAVALPVPVALYLLNQKRDRLIGLEQRYQITVDVQVDGELIAGELRVEQTEAKSAEARAVEARDAEKGAVEAQEAEPPARTERAAPEAATEESEGAGRKRRRRRRRRKGPGEGEVEAPPLAADADAEPDQPVDNGGKMPLVAADEPANVPANEPLPPSELVEEPRRPRPRRRRARVRSAPAATPAPASPLVAEARTENGAGAEPQVGHDAAADAAEPAPPARSEPRLDELAVQATRRGEPEDAEPEERDVDEGEVPAAAMLSQQGESTPRRGWWSRFVRKED